MAHHCHAIGCEIAVPPERLMCKSHWFMVPAYVRSQVWSSYRAGQCDDMRPSGSWMIAATRAIVAVAVREGIMTHEQAVAKITREIELYAERRVHTTLVNLKNAPSIKRDHDAVYIGRGSPFGNPFSHISDSKFPVIRVPTREQAIASYRTWINSDTELIGWTKPTHEQIMTLYGKALGCYCLPYPCHGEVLIDYIEAESPPKNESQADPVEAARRDEPAGVGEAPRRDVTPSTSPALAPFLRWPGGKRWLVDKLVPEILACKPTLYVEPFLGAGAIALALPIALPKLLSDFSEPLINVWKLIQESPRVVHTVAQMILNNCGNTSEGYLLAREHFNSLVPPYDAMTAIERAALMLYLNATSYNGVWRESKKSGYNVPFGRVKTPAISDGDELVAISEHLVAARIYHEDYRKIIASLAFRTFGKLDDERVVIYADPPYHGGFDDYLAGGFSDEQHRELADMLHDAADAGFKVFSTNADTEYIRSLYQWAQLEIIDESRNVAQKVKSRKAVACLLIRGG